MTVNDIKTAEADDRKAGMTVDEVGALLQAALKAGATGNEVIEITTVGWAKPRIKTAKVTIAAADSK